MNLILWRHAEAEDLAPGSCDQSRCLTERGRKQARAMAHWLNAHLPDDTQILVSPAVRTRQTAEALGRAFDIEPDISTEASVADHLRACGWDRRQGEAKRSVLMIGHQPTLGQIAAQLMCGQPLAWSVKKSAVWWLSYEGAHAPARLVCVIDSKTL